VEAVQLGWSIRASREPGCVAAERLASGSLFPFFYSSGEPCGTPTVVALPAAAAEDLVRNKGLIAAMAAIAIAVGFGVWSPAEQRPTATFLTRARDAVSRLAGAGRAPMALESDTSWRESVTCPPANDRTMVALVFGQSQAANQVEARFVGSDRVLNHFHGRCYRAADPLLGTDGGGGNVWTLVGNELVGKKRFDSVVLVTAAVSGSPIGQWAPGGRLHAHLLEAVHSLGPGLSFTHVFIQQGESDLTFGTTGEDYLARFGAVITALRQNGIDAPIFVAIESGYCDGAGTPPAPDNPIALAQKQLIAGRDGIYFGPDMDAALDSASDRHDRCHLSGTGARKLSRLWEAAIAAPRRSN
jgi:lysophospholipase L1-like esterase